MAQDVLKMVRAALKLTQPMPWAGVVPEVDLVARHGKAVVPQLILLLPDDPTDPNDRRLVYDRPHERLIIAGEQFDQGVQQQAAMALCKSNMKSASACCQSRSNSKAATLCAWS